MMFLSTYGERSCGVIQDEDDVCTEFVVNMVVTLACAANVIVMKTNITKTPRVRKRE